MKNYKIFIFLFCVNCNICIAQCWKSLDCKGDTNSFIFAIRDDHTLWDFTLNSAGVQVGTENIWHNCYSSFSSTFLIALDSTLWGWGSNEFGELGIGNTISQQNIIQLNSFRWIDISSTFGTTYGIRSDGTLWYWGRSFPSSILSPIQIGSANDWKEIQSAFGILIALKNNGTIWEGSFGNALMQIGADSDWSYIWAAETQWWAIKNNGTLWYNGVQVGNDNNWQSIKSDEFNGTFGIKTNGTLWYWPHYYASTTWTISTFDPLVSPTQIITLNNYQLISIYMNNGTPSSSGYNIYSLYSNNQFWIDKFAINAPCPQISANCANNTAITPQINPLTIGSTASFNATTTDPNPNFIWQSDFGQGYVTLNNYGNYSGTNTGTLNLANLQLANHNQPIRVISTSDNCIDTSNVAVINILDTCITNVTIYDTLLTTVTDTLIINTLITSINPPNNLNTIRVYPNPTNTHLTIDYGNFSIMNGYQLKIENSLGQQVYQTNITQQIDYLNLSTWGGIGLYFVHIINPQGNTTEKRKVVLQ